MADPLQTHCSPISVITPNLVDLDQTVWVWVGRPKNWEAGAIPLWHMDVADPLQIHSSPICVIAPNFVTVGQTVWA